MPRRTDQGDQAGQGGDLTGPGVVTHEGEQYLSIARAGEYLGRKRAAVFNYINRFGLETYRFPLEGKRVFLRRRDLDALRHAAPRPGRPKRDPKRDAAQARGSRGVVEAPRPARISEAPARQSEA